MDLVWFIVLPVAGLVLGWTIRWLYARFQLSASEQRAERVKQDAIKEAEAQKKEILLEAKDQLIRERNQQERENRERRSELQRYERRLTVKEETLDKRMATLDAQEQDFVAREQQISEKEANLATQEEKYRQELERISGLTAQEAKNLIIQNLENEAKHDAQALLNKIEQEAQLTSEKKAREILVSTIQRIATETTSDITVATVSLPSDEMKGRIIGREGRNIRTLETLTGVDIIIDDTPEAVVISCFDPVRKEIAKVALERLISDGRIHPARIEEIVERTKKDMEQNCKNVGEHAAYDARVNGLSMEIIKHLGRLKFRYSYGQNVLKHSVEVSLLAGMLAVELGANEQVCRRAGLLHDIGKATDHEVEGTHVSIGVELARRCKESEAVIHCIEAHHGDVPYHSVEAVIVQVADAISSSRPGARRENLENYIKRLHDLEDICKSKTGVDKCYAISAGREVRVIVKPDEVSDSQALFMAKEIAKEIENNLQYPGQIKVNVIRETRATELAK